MDKIVNNTNIKTVESRRGKLLWAKTPHRDASEFTDLRYTAVECPQAIEFDKWVSPTPSLSKKYKIINLTHGGFICRVTRSDVAKMGAN
jgi:hypothetical protein